MLIFWQFLELRKLERRSKKKPIVPLFSATRASLPATGPGKYVTYCSLEFESSTEHGIFDKDTGIFTVFTDGIYFLHFNGLNWNRQGGTRVELRVEGTSRAASYAQDPGEKEQGLLALSALVKLNKGERVGVFLEKGNLCDGAPLYTRFSGIFFESLLLNREFFV